MASATPADEAGGAASVIRDGAIVADDWRGPADAAPAGGGSRMLTLEQWQALGSPEGAAVQLETGDDPAALLRALPTLALIAVHFATFTDGRGFSLARQIREAGFCGELRARGQLLPDQAHYLRRCGFNALEFATAERTTAALERLRVFSDDYQGAADQPLPLFRRRA